MQGEESEGVGLRYDDPQRQGNRERASGGGLAKSDDVPGEDVAWKSLMQRFLRKRNVLCRVAHGESGDAW